LVTNLPFADALTPMLGRLRARYRQSPLPAFLAWWLGELRACLPQRWQESLRVQEAEIWVHVADDRMFFERVDRNGHEVIGEWPRAGDPPGERDVLSLIGEDQARLPRILLLPRRTALIRRLSFPAAATGNIRALVGFEIDRQTPFRSDQVEFDCRPLDGEANAKHVAVELAVLPRELLNAQLAALGDLANRLDGVDTEAEGGRSGFNFLPIERRRPRDYRPMLINAALLTASLALLVIAMAQLVDNRRDAVVAVEAEVEAQRAQARTTAQLRKNLDEAAAAANFFAEHKAQRPSLVELIDALTATLPDDTFVERITVMGSDISLTVQSGSAAKLIELFQDSPVFRDPTLVGPVQPDAQSRKDRATLTLQVVAPGERQP